MNMASLLWCYVYTERSQLVQYFTHSLRVTSTRKMNAFSNETCLNVKHQPFIFQHIVQIYLNTYWETRLLRSLDQSLKQHIGQVLSSTTLSRPRANFLHQTCIAGLVKHLSPYTGHISEWMVFGQRLFAQITWITERCSLRDAFSGSVAIFIVDKWRHNDVIVIKLTTVIRN